MKIKEITKRSITLLVDFLFPKFCVECGKEGEYLCPSCREDIIPVVSQVCPECGRLSPRSMYHESCKKEKTLKGIIAAAYFEEGPIREMIHNLKYNGVTELAKPLGQLMAKTLNSVFCIVYKGGKSKIRNTLFTIHDTVLVPVPLHLRRQAQRGYNQAALLALEVSKHVDLPIENVLVKLRGTQRQVELKGRARRENLKRVFGIKKKVLCIKGKTVILIDDVYTTGSTLNECARALKAAGAKEIWGLVISRG